ncbi:hypothetical protein [Alteribacter aurantiacus]|uniref:hypothetical protein n=1 Tax=Alteribacter aurantiacus TaxID=254410 RepID=UPI00040D0B59|nr:hypothetical protein [Alteribacter aurantiacus]
MCAQVVGPPGPPGPPGPTGPQGPPGFSSTHAYIFNLATQGLQPGDEIAFSNTGVSFGPIEHQDGESDIIFNEVGDYAITFSVTGEQRNQFTLFLNDQVIPGTIYGSDDENQQTFGQVVVTITNTPSTLTLRYFNNLSIFPVSLQTPAGGIEGNVTASIFIQKLGQQVSVEVSSEAELLAALANEDISLVIVEPGTYDLSGSPPITRTTAVRIESESPDAFITLNEDQTYDYITIGSNVNVNSERILNVNQGITYASIPLAITNAAPGDTILLSPGTYTLTSQLIIDRSLTLRGISSAYTNVVFDFIPVSPVGYLSIRASDVVVENIHWIGPTTAGGDISLFNIPSFGFPEILRDNIVLQYNIFQGGRYTAFIKAQNLLFIGNTFLHNGNRDGLVFQRIDGNTIVYGNRFNGSATSRRFISIETANQFDFAGGSITVGNNFVTSFQQYILYNSPPVNLTFIVDENYIDHTGGPAGSTIIFFLPAWSFGGFEEILIDDNIIINPNPNRLGVFIDYRSGGTSIPADDQIQVYNNSFSVALPWGAAGDTVDPNYPVGYSTNAPVGMSLDVFDLQGNINF